MFALYLIKLPNFLATFDANKQRIIRFYQEPYSENIKFCQKMETLLKKWICFLVKLEFSGNSIISQVAALKELYKKLTPNEVKLAKADYIGFTVIPTLATIFVTCYWVIGMMKYHSPDWSAYLVFIPQYEVRDQHPVP